MFINDINSQRKLSILGNGWNCGEISLSYIGRHSCTSAILDEKDFEWEENDLKVHNQYLSFSNSMIIILKNLRTLKEEKYEFKNLKKIGLYRGDLNPEDLVLTNYFEKIPKPKKINHIDYEDEVYFLEFKDFWKGVYGEYYFEKGEEFEFKKLDISVQKLNTYNEYYDWGCEVKYENKNRKVGKRVMLNRKTKLMVHNK